MRSADELVIIIIILMLLICLIWRHFTHASNEIVLLVNVTLNWGVLRSYDGSLRLRLEDGYLVIINLVDEACTASILAKLAS